MYDHANKAWVYSLYSDSSLLTRYIYITDCAVAPALCWQRLALPITVGLSHFPFITESTSLNRSPKIWQAYMWLRPRPL